MPNIISFSLLVFSVVPITCLFLYGTTWGWIPSCVSAYVTLRVTYSVFLRFQTFSREEVFIQE